MGIWDIVAGPILKIIDKVIPDPAAKAQAQIQLLQLQQAGEFKQMESDLQLALGQMDINKVEAASGNKYASSWRPTVGYICCAGLVYTFLLQPMLPWVAHLFGSAVPSLPALDGNTLMTLLGGMLGIGGMRSFEKAKGVAA